MKKAVKEVLKEDSDHKSGTTTKPKEKAVKCPRCKGKGYISEWKSEAYTGYGKYRSECYKCEGKQYIVVYDF